MALTWSSVAGKSYRVVARGGLAELEWVNVSPILSATGATTSWTNVFPAISPQLIYRVVLAP